MFRRLALIALACHGLSNSATADNPPPGRLGAAARPVAYTLELTVLPERD